MPAPKSNAPRHELFERFEAARGEFGDTNDCAVKAVAAACDAPYEQVHRLMRDLGRKHGKGTPLDIITKAVRNLGFKIKNRYGDECSLINFCGFQPYDFIQHYPKPHCTALKNVTTHHPERFPDCPMWKGRTFLMLTSGGKHIVCVKDGQNIDWSHGKAQRAYKIFEVTQ